MKPVRALSLVAILAGLMSMSLGTCRAARSLVPPPGFTAPVRVSDKDGHPCPSDALPYTGVLDFPSKYAGSDAARDDLNPQSEAEYRRRIAPISALERGLSQQVEDYLRSGRGESLACALGLLDRWSAVQALTAAAPTHTGKSMRKWALASVSSAYLRLKFSDSQPLHGHEALVEQVDAWLQRIAERVVAEWRDQPLEKINNHEYWAAWGVAAAAVALDRLDLFEWSLSEFRIATTQIDADGHLPNEMARDSRALYYHNYALTPLAMIAAFAKANDVAITPGQSAALARLAHGVLAGVDDPTPFEHITGSRQFTRDFAERSKFAWLEPFCWTFACDTDLRGRLDGLRPLKTYRMGGNLTDLFASTAALAARPLNPETPVHGT